MAKSQRVTLEGLREADPKVYAELCERAGFRAEAVKTYVAYSRKFAPEELAEGVHLAMRLKDYKSARELVKSARRKNKRNLRYPPCFHSSSGMLGAAMSYASELSKNERTDLMLKGLEQTIDEVSEKQKRRAV